MGNGGSKDSSPKGRAYLVLSRRGDQEVRAAYGVAFIILIVTEATRLNSVSSTSLAAPLTYPGLSHVMSHSPWAIPMNFHSPLRFDVAASLSPTRGRLATHFTSGIGAPFPSTIVPCTNPKPRI